MKKSLIIGVMGGGTATAEDAAAAMEILQQNQQIDLLFADIVMPGDINGRELAHVALKTWPDIKVLLTTGMEPESDKENRNPDEIPLLPKPYSSSQLAQRIRVVLDATQTSANKSQ